MTRRREAGRAFVRDATDTTPHIVFDLTRQRYQDSGSLAVVNSVRGRMSGARFCKAQRK
jgi:hypothetical protein